MTSLKKLIVLTALCIFSAGLHAQTKNEAIEAYNQAVGLMKTDVPGAINLFEKSIQISEQVGDSAVELKDKAIAVVPDLYYQLAYKNYTDKNVPGAISASKTTISVSDKYKNDKTKGRAETLLTQLYMLQGSNYFKGNENEKAIASFDSAMIVNPDYYKALLPKAQVYRKIDNEAKFGETIDLFIEKAANETDQVDQAKKLALDFSD
ncbi:MAG: hypothetical protein HC830_03870 [Bacteroidetes bacterium]|nr:hypothetical protein [Bacteroidota bacterium]